MILSSLKWSPENAGPEFAGPDCAAEKMKDQTKTSL